MVESGNGDDTYHLSIQNNSSENQTISVFQDYPNTKGKSVVWFQKKVGAGTTIDFEWKIKWGLTWGTTPEKLIEGVTFKQKGPMIDVVPKETGQNSATLSYEDDVFTFVGNSDRDLPDGKLCVNVTDKVTVPLAKTLQVAVSMDNKPAFVMHAKPNGAFKIDTAPLYYVAVTEEIPGTVISATYVSNPGKFQYSDGKRKALGSLDERLNFDFKYE